MSATAEQAGGAVGIAVLYAIFHAVYVRRLHQLIDTGPLKDLSAHQYQQLRDALQAAEQTGLSPHHFDTASSPTWNPHTGPPTAGTPLPSSPSRSSGWRAPC